MRSAANRAEGAMTAAAARAERAGRIVIAGGSQAVCANDRGIRRGVLRMVVIPALADLLATCGAIEENMRNNRLMTQVPRDLGYPAELHDVADVHNYTAWRDAFDPYLTRLLRQMYP